MAVKVACYKIEDIDRLINAINGLRMPVLDNVDAIKEIKEILTSAVGGEMEGGSNNGMEPETVRKD